MMLSITANAITTITVNQGTTSISLSSLSFSVNQNVSNATVQFYLNQSQSPYTLISYFNESSTYSFTSGQSKTFTNLVFPVSSGISAGTYYITAGVFASGVSITTSHLVEVDVTALTVSSSGTTIPSATQIVDSSYNVWTVDSGYIFENGTYVDSGNVIVLLYYNGVIYQENSSGNWWSWNGSTWTAISGDPRVSASGTTIPSASQIVDSSLNVWTVNSGYIFENGTYVASGNVILLLYYNGVIYQENSSNNWWSWGGSAWTAISGDPRVSASGTTIPSASQIIDSSGNVWTVVSGYIYENGTYVASGNVILLLYYNGVIYQENSSGNWWSWGGSSWTSISSDPRSASTSYAVQTLIDDMALASDSTAQTYMGGQPKATIIQGIMRGDAVAAWVPAISTEAAAESVSSVYWSKSNDWFVLYDASGNQDSSTYVEFRNDQVYYLYSNGLWVAKNTAGDETWSANFNGYSVTSKTQSDGHMSYAIPGNTSQYIHGGHTGGMTESSPATVVAIHHRMEARLVMSSSSYNSSYTKKLLQVGLDLIPPVSLGVGYNPGCGGSRARWVTPDWQVYTFTTVKPNSNPGVVVTPVNASLKTYITESELRANPPPGFK